MNKRRITLTHHDNLLDVFEKVALFPDSIVTIETESCPTIANFLSFRILLSRFPDRKFQIVTSDRRLKRISESLGIRTFSKNGDLEFETAYAEKNLLKHNFTFFEYLAYEMRKFFSYLAFRFQKRRNVYKGRKVARDSGALLLVLGLVISLSLLAFIFYFAVSKTYVYITPELSIRTTSRNLVFTERQENTILDTKNVVLVRNVEFETEMDHSFNVSTYDTGSVRSAHGKIEFFNELTTEQDFRPNTRLVTEDGLVFRTSGWVKIPATRTQSGETIIGKTQAAVYADIYDAKGDLIGVRGNIAEGVVLSAPGLKFNRDKIYAKTLEAFRDGQDPTVKIVTAGELDKFKAILAEKLRMKAIDGLKAKIRDTSAQAGTTYEIIPIDDNIKYPAPTIVTGSGMGVGSRRGDVSLHAKAKASAYAYDKGAAVSYLTSVLRDSLLYGTEKLHTVNQDSFRITNILFQNAASSFSMKATAELDASISYNFEDPTNNLTKKLKNLIVGTTEKEATSILLNDGNVAGVKLRFSPFWLTRVSSNPDAIEFIIEK
ncbi:MAG: hypothetical protein QG650_634 [Patescibacteria group bacterium]|nr:hypothetical protein [Patescibacteria group bacterium]